MTSSLDAIEDTALAASDYFKGTVPPESGQAYTKVYGILQVTYVQQDALRHLYEALGKRLPASAVLEGIRGIRNKSVGHPTRRGEIGRCTLLPKTRGRKLSFHYISRITLSEERFQLISVRKGKEDDFVAVDIRQILTKQLTEVSRFLAELVAKLESV